MKLCHAAALALVGWYLMVPPLKGPNLEHSEANTDAPLKQWHTWEGFDSAKDCNKSVAENYEQFLKVKKNLSPAKIDQLAEAAGFTGDERRLFVPWMERAFPYSICVPADDPRLK